MLNLWLGLCKGVPGLPDAIRKLHFHEHSIEPVISNEDKRNCNPELIIQSEKCGHCVLFEWKGGKNTEADQLQRYSRLSSTNLQRTGHLSVKSTKTFDVVIVGAAEHCDRLKVGLTQEKYDFPLLSVDDKGIHLILNRFKCPQLNSIFAPSLLLDYKYAPTKFVRIDPESPSWEVADVVIPRSASNP